MITTSLRAPHYLSVGFVGVLMLVASSAGAMPVNVFLLGGQSNMVGQAPTAGLPAALQSPQDDVLFYYRYQGSVTPLTTLGPGSGGSSANGFGPEVTFGRSIADALPDERFALIKHAANGTTLYGSWDPTPEGPAQGGTYAGFQNTVSDGLAELVAAGYSYNIVGMLWTQGETDANNGQTTGEYEANLIEFIADVRSRYGANLPFFFNRLGTSQTQISLEHLANIRTAQEHVAAAVAHAYLIDIDGLTRQQMADTVHFGAAGQMILGERFAQAYINSIPEPATLMLATLGGLVIFSRRRRPSSTKA
ncbi:MAG: sialate O-acetylesterase [Phycisphaeraceae bacterium]